MASLVCSASSSRMHRFGVALFVWRWQSNTCRLIHILLLEFRVNGIVRNVDRFYDAFDVHEGDAMYLAPDQRVHIW